MELSALARSAASLVGIAALLVSTAARADPASPQDRDQATEDDATPPAPRDPTSSVEDGSRTRGHAAASPTTDVPAPKVLLTADPLADGAIIGAAAAFAGLLDLINSTGEIRPQQISPNFNRAQLLAIDRGAISQDVDPNARTFSNIGLFALASFALIDPILSGIREQSLQSGLVDAFMYAESFALTWSVTNLAKMAVRRPRPQAYIDAARYNGDPNYANGDTDSALSFFSGHASIAASLSATATYLAFARSPHSPRPWLTLGLGMALTAFVSVERVRGGAHFPTDVIAGALAGAAIGVIVPHLHRSAEVKQRAIWLGFTPEQTGGGTVRVSGQF